MSKPRVYVQVGADPPLAGDAAVQALVLAAGGEPFLIPPGGSTRVSWEELMEFDPQLVLYAIPGRGIQQDPLEFLGIEGWDKTEAAVMRRVYSVDASILKEALEGLLKENFWGGSEFESPLIRRLFQNIE